MPPLCGRYQTHVPESTRTVTQHRLQLECHLPDNLPTPSTASQCSEVVIKISLYHPEDASGRKRTNKQNKTKGLALVNKCFKPSHATPTSLRIQNSKKVAQNGLVCLQYACSDAAVRTENSILVFPGKNSGRAAAVFSSLRKSALPL